MPAASAARPTLQVAKDEDGRAFFVFTTGGVTHHAIIPHAAFENDGIRGPCTPVTLELTPAVPGVETYGAPVSLHREDPRLAKQLVNYLEETPFVSNAIHPAAHDAGGGIAGAGNIQ